MHIVSDFVVLSFRKQMGNTLQIYMFYNKQ